LCDVWMMNHRNIQTAYSVFLLETAQTALTGADVYYWFMAGFGDVEGLKKSRFSPIDIPTMGGLISLIVQVFFCYRIWKLNRRLWWLCVVIAVVSLIRRTSRKWLKLLWPRTPTTALFRSGNWSTVGWAECKCCVIEASLCET
jgi:hypothetical protein